MSIKKAWQIQAYHRHPTRQQAMAGIMKPETYHMLRIQQLDMTILLNLKHVRHMQ